MTRLTALTLLVALATTPCLAQNFAGGENTAGHSRGAETSVERDSDPSPRRFTAVPQSGNPHAASARHHQEFAELLCGGDAFITFDPDLNGDPIDGTVGYHCLPDA